MTRFTRRTLPAELADTARWPEGLVAPTEVAAAATYRAAVLGYLEGRSMRELLEAHGLETRKIIDALNRCLSPFDDGQIAGWRGLLPRSMTPSIYRRTREPAAGRSGNAGALTWLFTQRPQIAETLRKALLRDQRKKTTAPPIRWCDLHALFIKTCDAQGIGADHYPFNTKTRGRRSLESWAKAELKDFTLAVHMRSGEIAITKAEIGKGYAARPWSLSPYHAVQMDAHRIDAVGTIEVRASTQGKVRIPITRLWIITILCVNSLCVLGFAIVIGEHCSSDDVRRALHCAITRPPPQRPRPGVPPAPSGTGLPSEVIPELEGVGWSLLYLDNAIEESATQISERARQHIGCAFVCGPRYTWHRRNFIEGFFRIFEQRGFHLLKSTTGSNPTDPRRRNPAQKAVDANIDYDDLVALVYALIAQYNGSSSSALDRRSPLLVLREWVNSHPAPCVFPLPRPSGSLPALDVTARSRKVLGSTKRGERPYINFEKGRYTSPTFSERADLLGKRITVHVRDDDIRTLDAFDELGNPLGSLEVMGHWRHHAHTLRWRQLINRLAHDDALTAAPGGDLVAHYHEQQEALAASGGRGAKKAATQAARERAASGLTAAPTPQPPISVDSEPARGSTPHRVPSFIRSLKR